MAKPFLFGDSHAKCMANTDKDGDHEFLGWLIRGISGGTAHNLVNNASVTHAGASVIDCLDINPGDKDVYLMFGDVDCVNHLTTDEMVNDTLARYATFVDILRARSDVRTVSICSVYPRTSVFVMNGRGNEEIVSTIKLWNSLLQAPIDTHTPLLGDDGFLFPEFSNSPTDPGERHLSKKGSAVIWDILRSHHSASVI